MNSIRRHTRKIVFVTLVVAGFIFREAAQNFFMPLSIAAQPSRSEFRSNGRGKEPDASTKARISRSYGALPMLFEANHDQTDARVRFIARGGGYALFLSDNEATLRLRKSNHGSNTASLDSPMSPMGLTNPITTESAILRMKLIGANQKPRISGLERLQT